VCHFSIYVQSVPFIHPSAPGIVQQFQKIVITKRSKIEPGKRMEWRYIQEKIDRKQRGSEKNRLLIEKEFEWWTFWRIFSQ
jgi:hypothetical protein